MLYLFHFITNNSFKQCISSLGTQLLPQCWIATFSGCTSTSNSVSRMLTLISFVTASAIYLLSFTTSVSLPQYHFSPISCCTTLWKQTTFLQSKHPQRIGYHHNSPAASASHTNWSMFYYHHHSMLSSALLNHQQFVMQCNVMQKLWYRTSVKTKLNVRCGQSPGGPGRKGYGHVKRKVLRWHLKLSNDVIW